MTDNEKNGKPYFYIEEPPYRLDVARYNGELRDNALNEAESVHSRLVGDRTQFTVGEVVMQVWIEDEGTRLKISASYATTGDFVAYAYDLSCRKIFVLDGEVEQPVSMEDIKSASILTDAHRKAFLAARMMR